MSGMLASQPVPESCGTKPSTGADESTMGPPSKTGAASTGAAPSATEDGRRLPGSVLLPHASSAVTVTVRQQLRRKASMTLRSYTCAEVGAKVPRRNRGSTARCLYGAILGTDELSHEGTPSRRRGVRIPPLRRVLVGTRERPALEVRARRRRQ